MLISHVQHALLCIDYHATGSEARSANKSSCQCFQRDVFLKSDTIFLFPFFIFPIGLLENGKSYLIVSE